MIKKVRIAVDHGNRNMKTCSQVFTTGLTIQDKKPARGEKFLFYEGKYYVLSENRIPYQRDKTQDDRFFILTLFAIVKELEENPQIQPEDVIQVDLPIGLPPKHYAELCERYEAYFKRQALEKGAKICMNKLQFDLVKETLLEYAYKESNGEGATFHKILLVKKNSEITSIIQTELLKKGIYMIMVETIWEAEDKLLECQDIELILCDLFLQDGIAMDFFHSMKKLAGIYQNTKEPIFRELPFFIFTDNKDLSLEYQYRHEGVSDYITSPVNIPELIRRICYFVEE